MELNKLTDKETGLLLRFTEAIVEAANGKNDAVAFTEMTAEQSERQARDQALRLIERRKRGVWGRLYSDDSEEGLAIREQVRKHLRARKILVDEE